MTALTPEMVADLSQENARLQTELRAARDRQAGSAEILRAIASAHGDAEQALQQIAEITARLFGAPSVTLRIADGNGWVRTIRFGDSSKRIGAEVSTAQLQISGNNLPGAVMRENRQIHIPDVDNPEPSMTGWPGLAPARAAGTRVMAGTPLRRENKAIGVLIVYRDRLVPFTVEELALQQSFADQAVIAIENARLFNETQEALERQTATSEILRVINNSGGDLAPVFDCILEHAHHLCGAPCGSLQLYERDRVVPVAIRGMTPAFAEFLRGGYPITEGIREALFDHPVQRLDMAEFLRSHPGEPSLRAAVELGGIGTMVTVPLTKNGVTFGRIVAARQEVRSFTDKQIALLQGFADQAVIAIENARLFNETNEALERQTATADILKVIASSPSDVQPVFEAIAASSNQLIGGLSTAVHRVIDDALHLAAFTRTTPAGDAALQASFPRPLSSAAWGENIRNGETVHIPDVEIEWAGQPSLLEMARLRGFRSLLFVPLLRHGATIGIISVSRKEAGRFAAHHVLLLQTFADQAVIAIENVRLFNETREALEQQKASADILSVISRSVADPQPVFDKILRSIEHLFGGDERFIFLAGDDGLLHIGAVHGPNAERARALFPVPLQGSASEAAMRERRLVTHADVFNAPDVPPVLRETARRFGKNYSMVVAPMLWEDRAIGSIFVGRTSMEPFGDKECALLRTFADQAVIAIQNARLFNETREALERQTATADILKVIASSPSDVQPVFEAIATSANRLVGGYSTTVFSIVDETLHLSAFTPTNPTADAALKGSFPIPLSTGPWSEQTRNGEIVQVPDIETDPAVPENFRKLWRMRGFRSLLLVPLLRDRVTIGMINVTRTEPGAFAAHHVQLLQTFADQAVIAIENTRLFNETKEALERQTATAEILKVIASSPSDVQPVFEAIATSSNRLIGGFSTAVLRFVGDTLYLAAFTPTNAKADEALRASFPRPLAEFPPFLLVRDGETQEFTDTESEEVPTLLRDLARLRGYRGMLFTPLMSNGLPIGMISVTRKEPGTFAAHHVQLVRTFADQAVIAIENVRLFDEVQARTHDLTEALQQQTATADVLKVISRSAFDLNTVLNTLIQSGAKLCEAPHGVIWLRRGEKLHLAAHVGYSQDWVETARNNPITPDPEAQTVSGRVAATGEYILLEDILADERFKSNDLHKIGQYRAILMVPLIRDGKVEGTIGFTRFVPGPFTQRQIELVQTFADQAVIAIENVRLFDEVQAKTRDLSEALQFQTATSDVLKVISRSPDALQPVLDVIVETSRELCGSDASTIFLLRDGKFHVTAVSGTSPAHLEFLQANPADVDQPGSVLARVAREKRTLNFANVADDPELNQGITGRGGPRALLSVPLMSDGQVIGVISLRQSHLTPFTARQVEAIEVFADQAVIAISNVGLFEQVQQRTRELSQSLDELRTAQDRLVQTEKLASLGQLTAGIAHEIKNPLNFVNNFAALSAELTDELNEVLSPVALDHGVRAEVDDLTRLLKDNLEKVVQHGKRADSIVKNMLLHSRDGSGEHRLADINALLDESLNLAYHGARAEKPQFNVTLRRDFDDMAGVVELFPQEITRVFLNLISNGFYAVTKRKAEDDGTGFEPVLHAATRDLGDTVEIRIRDNGTGIPTEVKEKMFNPFFTTKPAGEGTGLGLSISHDIIVKQHGGRIDVETEPGQFTEFRIVLPRTSSIKQG